MEKRLALERSAAFDLIDALSRSGGLAVEDADLHIVVAATHCFERSLMDTVVQGNVNPVERAERSALIMASVVQNAAPQELVVEAQLPRVTACSPQLFAMTDISTAETVRADMVGDI